MTYHIVGLDKAYEEPTPVRVETFYDRQTRSYISFLVDVDGAQVGEALFDGDKTGRDASVRILTGQLADPDALTRMPCAAHRSRGYQTWCASCRAKAGVR